MATLAEKLADSLAALKAWQDSGSRVLQGSDLSRTHRQRLLANGFLQEVVRGWYLPARPDIATGDTTAWRIGMPDFIAGYCSARFGEGWHVGPEQSLLLRTGERTMPAQVQIWAAKAQNQRLPLLHGYSLYLYAQMPRLLPAEPFPDVGGIRLATIEAALVYVSPHFFVRHRLAAQLALASIQETSLLLRILLEGSHSVVAGRLAGGLRTMGRGDLADEVVTTMRSAGYRVDVTSPFEAPPAALLAGRVQSPYAARLRLMWEEMREPVVRAFADVPLRTADAQHVSADIDARYVADAYNSLSIEGYQVSAELIERVRTGAWDPDGAHKNERDAMAARGYAEGHKQVRAYILQAVEKQELRPTEKRIREELGTWYRALFNPSVQAGIVKAADLAGWRNDQVYLKNARHVPLPKEAVRDCMPVLFELIASEPHPSACAVLAHFAFVYIHPYMDGNGRLGRFLLNALLVPAGYVWTIVPLERRTEYMQALDAASSDCDIEPFARFIAALVREQAAAPLAVPKHRVT